MFVWIVYSTNGYTCSDPVAAFAYKEDAESYAEENGHSGVKMMGIYQDWKKK